MTERNAVEIDYCPKCGGIWLDRGELDKIIDRAADASSPRAVSQRSSPDHHHDERGHRPHKKKESFLGELFGF